MRHMVVLVFDYTATEWAAEYGLTEGEAPADFRAVLGRAVYDGGLLGALDAAWPMMRGHLTAHTVDHLDPAVRDDLLHELREAHQADHHAALLADVRAHLAARREELSHREPRWVIFRTREFDDGYFLTGSGATVYLADGDSITIDLGGTSVDDLLTDLYGSRGSSAALGIDLKTAAAEYDDYRDNIAAVLGTPAPTTPETLTGPADVHHRPAPDRGGARPSCRPAGCRAGGRRPGVVRRHDPRRYTQARRARRTSSTSLTATHPPASHRREDHADIRDLGIPRVRYRRQRRR